MTADVETRPRSDNLSGPAVRVVGEREDAALKRCLALGLSPARLRFYRWLVRTGRLHD